MLGEELPIEICEKIILYLNDVKDVLNVSLCSKSLYRFLSGINFEYQLNSNS